MQQTAVRQRFVAGDDHLRKGIAPGGERNHVPALHVDMVYLAALGKNLRNLAELNIYKTQYLKNKLLRLNGWQEVFSAPVYNEFVLRCPNPKLANEKLKNEGIIGGFELQKDYQELKNTLLFCATEMLSKEDIDKVVAILK